MAQTVSCPLLPTEDRVVLRDEALPPASSLLVVVESKPSYRGTVVAKGPDVVELDLGDLVQYRPFVGTRIEVDGVSWIMVREEECVCRLS